jgi:hypothetical protein
MQIQRRKEWEVADLRDLEALVIKQDQAKLKGLRRKLKDKGYSVGQIAGKEMRLRYKHFIPATGRPRERRVEKARMKKEVGEVGKDPT